MFGDSNSQIKLRTKQKYKFPSATDLTLTRENIALEFYSFEIKLPEISD